MASLANLRAAIIKIDLLRREMATESTLEENNNTPMHEWVPVGVSAGEES